MKPQQMTVLDTIDRENRMTARMRVEQIREKLKNDYVTVREKFGVNDDYLPDGLIVIYEMTKYETTGMENHFYRCVVGHHMTVSGMASHLISKPDEEWPDIPAWHYDNSHKCKWTYPGRNIWCKKIAEYVDIAEVDWTEASAGDWYVQKG